MNQPTFYIILPWFVLVSVFHVRSFPKMFGEPCQGCSPLKVKHRETDWEALWEGAGLADSVGYSGWAVTLGDHHQ